MNSFCKRFPALLALAACLLASAYHAGAAVPTPNGIYLIVSLNKDMPNDAKFREALAKDFVDGVYVRSSWMRLEPKRDVYDWSSLDQQVSLYGGMGKKVSIGVDTGERAPDWLYTIGAKGFQTMVEIPRQKDFGQIMRLPIPWDPVFLQEWTKFVAAFGQHFASNPHISIIKITGIAYRTDELLLPRGTGETKTAQGKTVTYPNDVANWQAVDYTTGKMDQAFSTILGAYQKAFPEQYFAIMTGEHGFPPLGDRGQMDTAAANVPDTDFRKMGQRALGQRFIAQVNNLTDFRDQPTLRDFSRTGFVGFQAAWPVTEDTRGIMNHGVVPFDALTVMKKTLDIALSANACYLELFRKDLLNPELNDLFTQVHRKLMERSLPAPSSPLNNRK